MSAATHRASNHPNQCGHLCTSSSPPVHPHPTTDPTFHTLPYFLLHTFLSWSSSHMAQPKSKRHPFLCQAHPSQCQDTLGTVPPPPGRPSLTLSFWKEWRKLPPSSPSSLGVPGGLLMPLMLFGEFCGGQEGRW